MAFDYSKNVKGKDETAQAIKLRQEAEQAIKKAQLASKTETKPKQTNAPVQQKNIPAKNVAPKVPYGTKGYLVNQKGERIQATVNPIAVGLTKVASFGTSSLLPGMKEAEEQAQKQFPKSYVVGQVLGYASPTGLAKGVTKGLVKGATQKIGSQIGKNVVEGAIIGTGAEATQLVKPLLMGEMTPKQAGKQLATGLVAGAGIDVGVGLIGKLAKPIADKMLSGKALTEAEKIVVSKTAKVPVSEVDNLIDQTVSAIKPSKLKAVAEDMEATIVKPLIKQDVEQSIKPIAEITESPTQIVKPLSYQDAVKPIKIDTGENLALQKAKGSIAESALPVKEIPKTYNQIVDDFQNWRIKIGSKDTGANSKEEVEALKKMYFEDTGIDFDKELEKIVTPIVKPIKSIAEDMGTTKIPSSKMEIKLGEPDTKVAKVLTEMPTKKGIPFKEKLAKVYQETVSSDLPLERIGRANDKVTNLTSTLRKVGGSVDYNLETALTDIEGNEVGQSLFSVFKDVPKENKADLFEYALHKHNLARYEQAKPVFGDTVDTVASQQRLTELSTNPQLEAKAKEMNQYINGLMDNWALKSGLVNEDTLAQLRQMYPDYVPTYRNKDVAKPMIVGGTKGSVSNVIKKATGGSSDILPLDQQMAMLTNKVIRASRKNELYNSLYDTFESNPEFAERWFKPITKEGTDLTEGIDGIVDNFEEPIKKVGDTYELSFFRNGEKVKAEISKDLYDAIKPLSEVTGIENVAALVKKYGTNPFKSLITTYNPIFVVRNILRDIPTAFIYSKDAVEWSKQMPIALKEIVSNGDAWKEYRALGGTRSGIFSYDKPTKIAFKGGNDNLAVKGAKGVLNGVETLNNVTETLPRFAEYLATVKKGGGTYESKLKGIMRASEITTDFSRSGKVTKTVDAFVPYLNPSVQGIDKFVRQVTERPLQTALKGGLTITVPTLILDQINKNDRAYQEMTEREKNQYYLIPDGEGQYTRIPKSREVGVVFSSLFDWIARRSRGEEVKPSEIASTIKENFTPVNMVENNLFAPLIKSIQQIKDPERDVKNYAGISIVPTGLKYYEPKEQYDAYTSEVGKQIGQIAGISPKVVDYLIRSYSGVLGQTLMPKTSATQRGVLESAFKTDPVFKSGNVNDFYEELDKQTKELAKQKRDNPDRVDTALSKTVKMLNKTSRELSELRKEQKSIDQSNKNDEVKKKKIRDLQIQMNNITREALLKGGR